jgi:hypothetical protein
MLASTSRCARGWAGADPAVGADRHGGAMSRTRAWAPRATALAIVCAVILVGCSAQDPTPASSASPDGVGTAEAGVSSGGQAAVAGPAPVDWSQPGPGLRGTRLSTGVRCGPALQLARRQWREEQRHLDDPDWRPAPDRPVRGDVDLVRMCPTRWDPVPRRDLVAGTELFALAVAALGAADGRALDELGLCSLEGDPTVRFVARTSSGTWLLHTPQDPCGHPVDRVDVLYRRLLT